MIGLSIAERGSRVEGEHTPSGRAEPGESRLEQMREVDVTSDRDDDHSDAAGEPVEPGPSPADIGSGGARRIEGARISDRVAGGAPHPDGPPFDDTDTDSSRGTA